MTGSLRLLKTHSSKLLRVKRPPQPAFNWRKERQKERSLKKKVLTQTKFMKGWGLRSNFKVLITHFINFTEYVKVHSFGIAAKNKVYVDDWDVARRTLLNDGHVILKIVHSMI